MLGAFIAWHADVFNQGLGAAHPCLVGVGLGVQVKQAGTQQAGEDDAFHEGLLGLRVGMAVSVRAPA